MPGRTAAVYIFETPVLTQQGTKPTDFQLQGQSHKLSQRYHWTGSLCIQYLENALHHIQVHKCYCCENLFFTYWHNGLGSCQCHQVCRKKHIQYLTFNVFFTLHPRLSRSLILLLRTLLSLKTIWHNHFLQNSPMLMQIFRLPFPSQQLRENHRCSPLSEIK